MPKVDFANLEPGSVVETPDALKAVGYKAPLAIFAGGLSWHPVFLTGREKPEELLSTGWPAPPPKYQPEPLPKEFTIVTAPDLRKAWGTKLRKDRLSSIPYHHSSGCDPELFVFNGRDKLLPARRFLGKKDKFNHYFYDGIQAEFTPEAQSCLEQLGNRLQSGLSVILNHARRINKNARLTAVNSYEMSSKEMALLEDEDLMFRCSSSLNIYNDIPAIPDAKKYPWRFAGGHIHIGSGKKSTPVVYSMVRALDTILGVAAVSLARKWDNPERRRNYGRAGEFRMPSHGLEYRVLSNYWLCHPLIYHLTFEIARFAYRIGESGALDLLWEGTEQETRDCINNCDVSLATKLISQNAWLYNQIFKNVWGVGVEDNYLVRKAEETIMNGLETVVKHPDEIETNWCLSNDRWVSMGDGTNQKWRRLSV